MSKILGTVLLIAILLTSCNKAHELIQRWGGALQEKADDSSATNKALIDAPTIKKDVRLKALRNVAITTVIYMGSMLAAKAVVERTLVAYRNYTYPAVNLGR